MGSGSGQHEHGTSHRVGQGLREPGVTLPAGEPVSHVPGLEAESAWESAGTDPLVSCRGQQNRNTKHRARTLAVAVPGGEARWSLGSIQAGVGPGSDSHSRDTSVIIPGLWSRYWGSFSHSTGAMWPSDVSSSPQADPAGCGWPPRTVPGREYGGCRVVAAEGQRGDPRPCLGLHIKIGFLLVRLRHWFSFTDVGVRAAA